ncbi:MULTISPECIES: hypothetical protein [Agrobacterium]|uniref:hypothetical protein n=1 Tax=Agrobacterium TaxID=357 RepID=UPI0009D47CCA|nr:hypothetical protein AGR9A_Lc40182 [Agrobacterium salinitolerans str. Hayward 0363]
MSNMQDWNSYRDALIGRVGDFAKLSPDVLRGLNIMEASGNKTGKIEPKMREIIALPLRSRRAATDASPFMPGRPLNWAPAEKRSPRLSAWLSRLMPALR